MRQADLKIYTKGERVLRVEVVAHNTNELDCGRTLEKFPIIVARLKEILERFMNALSWVDACFIADDTLERLPAASWVGKTKVGGIDFNKPRMRAVVEAALALSASPAGFTASDLALRVRAMNGRAMSAYTSRHASYDLKKLRGKEIVRKVGGRRYEPIPEGFRAIAALVVLRDKVIQPLLATLSRPTGRLKMSTATPVDKHYHALRLGMRDLFEDLGLAA
jgi:DNA-binding transcriptional ArsR family regulator